MMRHQTWLIAVFVLLLGALPLLPVPEFWITQANYIGLNSLVCIGLVLLTGIGGMTSFGQAAFVGIAAYTTAYLTTQCGSSTWLALLIGLLLTGVSAYVIGLITLRMSGHYLPLATIAWGLSLYYLFGNMEWLGRHDGISGVAPITLAGYSFGSGRAMFYLIWLFALTAVWLVSNLLRSRPGRAIRALKGGVQMAEAMGVHTARYKVSVFVLAALCAAVSGWLYAHLQGTVNPSPFNINMGIQYLMMVVVGGAGHVWGALLGAGVMTVLQDKLQSWLPYLLGTSGNFDIIVYGLILILILQHARDGIWPFIVLLAQKILPPAPALSVGTPPMMLTRRVQPESGVLLLEVDHARKQFGGLVAVNDISFQLRAGEIIGLIGPNGAGKSTMFNLITGVLPVSAGSIRFRGETISTYYSRQIVRRGIARTFQHVQLLPAMSVLENVALGAHLRHDGWHLLHLGAAMLGLDQRSEQRLLHEAQHQLQRVGLGELIHAAAGSLALGQQRALEIARALCCDPVLLLLDEPAAGLRYQEKQTLAALLRQLRAEGVSVLLVEHDMDFVMDLTDHLVVMEFGSKIAEGSPATVQNDPAVLEAYLGGID